MAYEVGDLVVLVSGSMRMAVEATEEERVSVVWCNEGAIGRDVFDARLLKKWEVREEGHGGGRGGEKGAERSGRSFRGEREGGGKPFRGDDGEKPRPRGKTGWDGKPREKKYFRKDD